MVLTVLGVIFNEQFNFSSPELSIKPSFGDTGIQLGKEVVFSPLGSVLRSNK